MVGKLAVYVHVDGKQYGPTDTVPADVAKRIDNPDVWAEEPKPAPRPAATK